MNHSLEELKELLASTLDIEEFLDLLELDMNDLVEICSDHIEENQEEIEERYDGFKNS